MCGSHRFDSFLGESGSVVPSCLCQLINVFLMFSILLVDFLGEFQIHFVDEEVLWRQTKATL